MAKKLAFISTRVPDETRDQVNCLADELGVTTSRLTRSLLERAVSENRKSDLSGPCGRLIEESQHLCALALEAASDGKIDIAERAELTRVESSILNLLWNGGDAA